MCRTRLSPAQNPTPLELELVYDYIKFLFNGYITL